MSRNAREMWCRQVFVHCFLLLCDTAGGWQTVTRPGDVGIMTIQILIIGLLAFIALGLSTIADTPNNDSE